MRRGNAIAGRLAIAFLALVLVVLSQAACDDGGTGGTTGAGESPAASPSPSTHESPAPSASSAYTVAPGLVSARVVRVVDGDTIDVLIDGAEYTVRYIGIDTPETVHPSRPVQCFGPEASAQNKELVEGKTVGLEKDVSETDQFGRLLRYVWVGGQMVNAALVRDGFAQSSTYPPDVKHQDLFVELQRTAREAGAGLWGAVCTSHSPQAAGGGACEYSASGEPVIKGNISRSSDEKIYHVPGQQYYDETVINESAGERWFCTEAEAQTAGWRKAKT